MGESIVLRAGQDSQDVAVTDATLEARDATANQVDAEYSQEDVQGVQIQRNNSHDPAEKYFSSRTVSGD